MNVNVEVDISTSDSESKSTIDNNGEKKKAPFQSSGWMIGSPTFHDKLEVGQSSKFWKDTDTKKETDFNSEIRPIQENKTPTMSRFHSSVFSLQDYGDEEEEQVESPDDNHESNDEGYENEYYHSDVGEESLTDEGAVDFLIAEINDDLMDMGLAAAQDGAKTVITQSFRAFAFLADSIAYALLSAHHYHLDKAAKIPGPSHKLQDIAESKSDEEEDCTRAIDREESRIADRLKLHHDVARGGPRAFQSIVNILDESSASMTEADDVNISRDTSKENIFLKSGSDLEMLQNRFFSESDNKNSELSISEIENDDSQSENVASMPRKIKKSKNARTTRQTPIALNMSESGYLFTPPMTPLDRKKFQRLTKNRHSRTSFSMPPQEASGNWRNASQIMFPNEPLPSGGMQQSGLFEDIEMYLLERVDLSFLALRNLVRRLKYGKRGSSHKLTLAESEQTLALAGDRVVPLGHSRFAMQRRFFWKLVSRVMSSIRDYATLRVPRDFVRHVRSSFGKLDILGSADRRLVHFDNVKERFGVGELVRKQGYPYQELTVVTSDGYILRLERLPQPSSRKVLFLQHGVMDSSFTWVANGAEGSLAFRAYDEGYDVFLGNFRGAGGDAARRHVNPHITENEFWNFSINEHAFKDIPAFIDCIIHTKANDLSGKEPPHVMGVAHSMGGAAMIMYTIHQRRNKQAHHLDGLVLISPAGIHTEAPLYARYGGRLLDLTAAKMLNSLRLPSDVLTRATVKFVHDIKTWVPALEDIISVLLIKALGGDEKQPRHGPFSAVNQLTYNVLTCGTSTKVFVHLRQLIVTGKFQAFDYEPSAVPNHFSSKKGGNVEAYGQPTPPEFTQFYNLIDVPVHLIAGLSDHLIGPQNVLRHFQFMKRAGVDVSLESIEQCGHIDFTVGTHTAALRGILGAIETITTRIEQKEKVLNHLRKKNIITAH